MTNIVKMRFVCTLVCKPSWWILTELARVNHWKGVSCDYLGFSDRGPIFKVAYALRMSYFDQKQLFCILSPELID